MFIGKSGEMRQQASEWWWWWWWWAQATVDEAEAVEEVQRTRMRCFAIAYKGGVPVAAGSISTKLWGVIGAQVGFPAGARGLPAPGRLQLWPSHEALPRPSHGRLSKPPPRSSRSRRSRSFRPTSPSRARASRWALKPTCAPLPPPTLLHRPGWPAD